MNRTAYSVLTTTELIELTDELGPRMSELEQELSQRLSLALDMLQEGEVQYGLYARRTG